MATEELRWNIVQVRGKMVGTGFFIGKDGSILTCFHLVRDPDTGRAMDPPPEVWFDKEPFQVDYLYVPRSPSNLDIVILCLRSGSLPEKASLVPLGTLGPTDPLPRAFSTWGFREVGDLSGPFPANGQIINVSMDSRYTDWLMLSPSAQTEQFRPGMSGAPVYDDTTGQVVGVLCRRYDKDNEVIPVALPTQAVADRWRPIRRRLQEERLLGVLLGIIRVGAEDWFADKALRAMYETLGKSRPWSVSYDQLDSTHRAEAVIAQVRKAGKAYDVIHYLRYIRKDIPESLLDPTALRGALFVNRDQEFGTACGPFAPQCVLFDAPMDFGKTSLLEAIAAQHFYDGWLSTYVDVQKRIVKAADLARDISVQAGGPVLAANASLKELAIYLGAILQQRLQVYRASGIVLLVDNIERLPKEEISPFFNSFLYDLNASLHDRLRVRLAGSYIGKDWQDTAKALPFVMLSLKPFDFKSVRETTRLILESAEDSQWSGRDQASLSMTLDLIAAHVMYITGGHPGCMIKLLEKIKDEDLSRPAEEIFQKNQEHYAAIALSYAGAVAGQVRDTLSDSLGPIFETLSIFRLYNARLLERIVEVCDVSYDRGVLALEKELTATYMVRRQGGFIRDEIVRRLLAVWLYCTNSARFLALCDKARQIYEEDLQATGRQAKEVAIEALYQTLRLSYYQAEPTRAARQALRAEFFAENGILNHYLDLLSRTAEAQDVDLKEAILEYLAADWEFQFSVNYFLRADSYDDQPYEQMLRQVEQFYAGARGGSND